MNGPSSLCSSDQAGELPSARTLRFSRWENADRVVKRVFSKKKPRATGLFPLVTVVGLINVAFTLRDKSLQSVGSSEHRPNSTSLFRRILALP